MLGTIYSEMIFVKGYVHSDPHPGNVLVHKTERNQTEIVLLDHGLYAVRVYLDNTDTCGIDTN